MQSWFLDREDSDETIYFQMGKVTTGQSKNNTYKLGTRVPFRMTYHPKDKMVGQLITSF